jgi:hypothetical protein
MRVASKILIPTILFVFLSVQHDVAFGQIQQRQVGRVYYHVLPSNDSLTKRNDSIAGAINAYILKYTSRSFPPVWLYIYDQSPDRNLEFVQVYYQEFKGQLFDELISFTGISGKHLGISIALYDSHHQNALIAIRYAVDNLELLKERLRQAIKRHKQGNISDEEVDYSFLFSRRN